MDEQIEVCVRMNLYDHGTHGTSQLVRGLFPPGTIFVSCDVEPDGDYCVTLRCNDGGVWGFTSPDYGFGMD